MATQSAEVTPLVGVNSGAGMTVYMYAVLGLVMYFVSVFAAIRYNLPEADWVVALFLIPALAPIIGVGIHVKRGTPGNDQYFYDFSMRVSFYSIFFYCVLWILHSLSLDSQLLSIVSLIGVAVLLGLVALMMCAFLHEMNNWPRLAKIRTGASNEPLWALCFLFFVIFLDVTYLFGFAFAFHDRSTVISKGNPALYMENVVSPDDLKPSVVTPSPAVASATPTELGQQSTEDTKFYFYFDIGHARVETVKSDCGLSGKDKDPTPIAPPQRTSWVYRDPKQFNHCSLEAIKLRLSQETRGGNRSRVILVGRSNDEPIKETSKKKREAGSHTPSDQFIDYKSNYELSEARTQNVRFGIVDALKGQDSDSTQWHNLEWLSLPSSNEIPIESDEVLKRILSEVRLTGDQKADLIDKNMRVVIASIASIPGDITSLQMKNIKPKPLKLMDYMYFSIYTITTTGYGDITPTTAYSKFVISVANICEVLFLVVFFNALVSIKRDKKQAAIEDLIDFVKEQKEKQQQETRKGPALDMSPGDEGVAEKAAE